MRIALARQRVGVAASASAAAAAAVVVEAALLPDAHRGTVAATSGGDWMNRNCALRRLRVPLVAAACAPQRRHKGYHFYLNLEDAAETQRHVQEELDRLAQEHKTDTAAYLHGMLNLAIAHYQAERFIEAREMAERAHRRALEYNGKSSFIFLTAKTCGQSCRALADAYAAHVAAVNARSSASPATLAPRPSVVFSAERAIEKLRADAARYDGIAARVYNRPENAFMRGWGNDGRGHEAAGEETKKKKKGNGRGGADTGESSPRGGGRRDWRRSFSEDTHDGDLGWEHLYGARWQDQRRRPEHAEVRRHHQSVANGSGGNWKVPK